MRDYNFGEGPLEGKASYVWSPAFALFEIGLAGGEVASTLPLPNTVFTLLAAPSQLFIQTP
jgi:hypothetical protein